MPKRIRNKDSSTFYYSYKIGKQNNKVFYGEVIEAKGVFTSYNSTKFIDYYGEALDYNATLTLQEEIKYIDNFSKIWIGNCPTDKKDKATHIVKGKTPIVDGLYKVYLKSNLENTHSLWIDYSGELLEITLDYDFEKKIAKIPNDVFCPINILTKVWETKPNDLYSKKGKINLLYSEINGNFTVLYFKKED